MAPVTTRPTGADTSTERPRRRPRHNRDALLDAARAEFARSGFEAASMDAIAERAGTTKPTLYDRFGSKKVLYEEAVARDAEALVDHLFAEYSKVAQQPVGTMVKASMSAYFGFFAERPDAFGLLFASGRSEPAVVMADQVLAAITHRLSEMVKTVLARTGEGREGSTRLLAAMLLGIAHHGVTAVRRDPTLDDAAAQALATDLALSGLRHLSGDALR
jgi:AcrR family transcriptional regulator